MAKAKTQYVCQNCGYISATYLGRCPNCGGWNTLVEETVSSTKSAPRQTRTGSKVKPTRMDEVTVTKETRVKTGLAELNRVLGGGVVPGSLVLIGDRKSVV